MKRPGSDNGSGSGSGEFVRQIRQILLQAGFELVDDADERTPGLRVLDADFGARITWTASDGFTALAERDRQNALSADTSSADVNMLVRTAVRGLMSQRGHTVTETDQGSALLVLATPPPRDAATDQ